MSQFGFVYVLRNAAMPGLYKVGCTEKSVHRRAKELSKATGVPTPFEVLCQIEVEDHIAAERELHRSCVASRASAGREFFTDIRHIVTCMYYFPGRLGFTDYYKGEFATGVIELINGDEARPWDCITDLLSPWEDPDKEEQRSMVAAYLRNAAEEHKAEKLAELKLNWPFQEVLL